MDKKQLRHELRGRLSSVSKNQRKQLSKQACQNLVNIEQFHTASVVMFFLSFPHEIDTTSAILHAWQQGKTVVVPKVSWQQRHMIAVEITSLDTGLSVDAGDMRNPVTGVPAPVEEIDLVVTPGLAFDINGGRLGRGGAYYDRFFATQGFSATKCGFAFSKQIVESVPTEAHDRAVDMIVTDQGLVNCKQ